MDFHRHDLFDDKTPRTTQIGTFKTTSKRKCCVELHSHFREDECLAGVPLSQVLDNSKCRLATDCIVQTSDIQTNLHALERLPFSGKIQLDACVPIRFVPSEKITKNDKLVLAFDALALCSACGKMPPFGKIIHGSKQATVKVQVAALMTATRAIVGRIVAQQASQTPPQLILNRHCPECEFRTRCHQIAVEKDELTLLAGMTEKERKRQHDKGIFTVTQLSYTFRARRKPKRLASQPDKYNHALKALAIRDHKIYVSGKPELKIKGTPVYLDVEGVPDRSFYYLIGLRVKNGDSYIQYSFWANEAPEEKEIWFSFLRTLAKIENPQLIHYGSYETQFLRQMKKRYLDTVENLTFTDQLFKESVNILSVIYAQFYFPTYSNGLKEIAQYLGWQWSDSNASGLNAMCWRYEWEFSRDSSLKQRLVTYNAEDCEALERVTGTIAQLCQRETEAKSKENSVVHVDTLKRESPYRWGKNNFAMPEMEYINQCAYWDYQRERIYLRSSQQLKRVSRKDAKSHSKAILIDEVVDCSLPARCPKCNGNKIVKNGRRSKTVYDLRFDPTGVKRRVVKYLFNHCLCPQCGAYFTPQYTFWTKSKCGSDLRSYLIYQMIELHLPKRAITQSLNQLFRLNLHHNVITVQKDRASKHYEDTYKGILAKIVSGRLIHADETKVDIEGKLGYVWVITNLEEVAYFYTETRDGDRIQALLKDFNGVLVSDFYAAYDSIDCPQQKCLIHLIRDLNDDLLQEPFNEELKQLVQEFALLLKPMVETIDSFGLKARFLRKHKIFVERFYTWLSEREYKTEMAVKNKKRFEKNRDKLFTFLDYNDVPWNNNNAEHAIKAFAALRKVIGGTSSDKGIREYLTLLSICETCKYKEVSFLDFLRSGEKDIDRFIKRIDPAISNT